MAKNKQENKKTFLSIIARPAKGFRRAGYDFFRNQTDRD